jgi:hypothetical protein
MEGFFSWHSFNSGDTQHLRGPHHRVEVIFLLQDNSVCVRIRVIGKKSSGRTRWWRRKRRQACCGNLAVRSHAFHCVWSSSLKKVK